MAKNLLIPQSAVITGITSESPDVRTYALSVNGGMRAAPGQFNMVGAAGVGEAPISFSSISKDGRFAHTIRAVGRVTKYLERLKEGQEVFLRGPYGRGWPVDDAQNKDIVLLAGGLGLAPIRPVVEAVIGKRGQFGEVTLIYGARDPLNMIFKDQLDAWRTHMSVHLTVDEAPPGWKHRTGFVTEILGGLRLSPEKTIAFVCGPEIMMRFAARGLQLAGVMPSRLYVSLERRMKCGVAQCGHCQHGSAFVCKDGPVFLHREAIGLPDGLL